MECHYHVCNFLPFFAIFNGQIMFTQNFRWTSGRKTQHRWSHAVAATWLQAVPVRPRRGPAQREQRKPLGWCLWLNHDWNRNISCTSMSGKHEGMFLQNNAGDINHQFTWLEYDDTVSPTLTNKLGKLQRPHISTSLEWLIRGIIDPQRAGLWNIKWMSMRQS